MGEPTEADMEKARELIASQHRHAMSCDSSHVGGLELAAKALAEARAEGHAAGRAEMAGEVRGWAESDIASAEEMEVKYSGTVHSAIAESSFAEATALRKLIAKLPEAP